MASTPSRIRVRITQRATTLTSIEEHWWSPAPGRVRIDTLLEKRPIDPVDRRGGIDEVDHFFEILTPDLLQPTPATTIECGLGRLVLGGKQAVDVTRFAGRRVLECTRQ